LFGDVYDKDTTTVCSYQVPCTSPNISMLGILIGDYLLLFFSSKQRYIKDACF